MSALGIPQISVVHGISVAGGAYLPAMSDATTIVAGPSGGHIFLAGPPLVRAATGEVVSDEELGGGEMHARVSGVTDYLARDDAEAIAMARGCVQDTGSAYSEGGDRGPIDEPVYDAKELHGIVGTDVRRPFDMRDVIARVVDGSRFREFKREYGETLVTVRNGATKFLQVHFFMDFVIFIYKGICEHTWTPRWHFSEQRHPILPLSTQSNTFHTAMLATEDPPPFLGQRDRLIRLLSRLLFIVLPRAGYMVGSKAERGGIAKDGAKMVRAVACADVPKFTVVVGGSFGAGNYGTSYCLFIFIRCILRIDSFDAMFARLVRRPT